MIADSKPLVFAAVNHHVADCGTPPEIRDDGSSPTYFGYFVNQYGEQWVVSIDRTNKTGLLRGGDIGWATEVRLVEGKIDGDWILARDELQWLDACWQAACGEPLAH